MASRHDSNGPLSPWTDDQSRCITSSARPLCTRATMGPCRSRLPPCPELWPSKGRMPLVDGGVREGPWVPFAIRVRPLTVKGGRRVAGSTALCNFGVFPMPRLEAVTFLRKTTTSERARFVDTGLASETNCQTATIGSTGQPAWLRW